MSAILISLLLSATADVEAAAPASIDVYCDRLAKYAGRKEHVPVIFAEVSDPDSFKNGRWLRLEDSEDLKRRAEENTAYTQGFVWRHRGGTYVSMFFTSPSGDWAEYVDYCFRHDGSLARSEASLNTFNAAREDSDGPVSRIRTKHFDTAGRLLRSRKRLVDTETRQPLRIRFQDDEERIFLSIRKLPFAELLP